MRAHLIYNATAGQRDWREALDEVVRYLRSLHWDVAMRETHGRSDATTYAREAVANKAAVVWVAGGDGTINEVINGLAYTNTALAVLPTGTANVWAQEIGLPIPNMLNLTVNPFLQGAHQLVDGTIRMMDLGKINERYFMLYGSVGFDAHIVETMEGQKELKKRIGGLAYYISGVAAAWNFIGTRATLYVDGKRLKRRIWAVMAANTQLYGGIIRIADQAIADDGWLDLIIIQGHGPLATIRHYGSFVLRGVMKDPQVEYLRARTVRITTRHAMPVQVDGDPAGKTPIHIEIAPKALRVLVPTSTPQKIFSSFTPPLV
jgi:YegS/Rv2252/BmrU family lipid kinase